MTSPCCSFSLIKATFGGGSPCISLSDYYRGGAYVPLSVSGVSPNIPLAGSPTECINLNDLCNTDLGCGDWSTLVSLGADNVVIDYWNNKSFLVDGTNVYIYMYTLLGSEPNNAVIVLDSPCGFLKELKTLDFAASPAAGFGPYMPYNTDDFSTPVSTAIIFDSVDPSKLKAVTYWTDSGVNRTKIVEIDPGTWSITDQVEVPIQGFTSHANLFSMSDGSIALNPTYWEADSFDDSWDATLGGLYISNGSPQFYNYFSLYNNFYNEQDTIWHDNVAINFINSLGEYGGNLVLTGYTEWRPTNPPGSPEGLWFDQDWISLVILDSTDYTNMLKKINISRDWKSNTWVADSKIYGDYAYLTVVYDNSETSLFSCGVLRVNLATSPMSLDWWASSTSLVSDDPWGNLKVVQHPTDSDIIYFYGYDTVNNGNFLVKINANTGAILDEWNVNGDIGAGYNFYNLDIAIYGESLFFGATYYDKVSSPNLTGQIAMKLDPDRLDTIASPGQLFHRWQINTSTAITDNWTIVTDDEVESSGYYISGTSPKQYGSPAPSPLPDNTYLAWDTYKVLTSYTDPYASIELLETQVIETYTKADWEGHSPEVFYGGSPGGDLLELRDRADQGTYEENEEI